MLAVQEADTRASFVCRVCHTPEVSHLSWRALHSCVCCCRRKSPALSPFASSTQVPPGLALPPLLSLDAKRVSCKFPRPVQCRLCCLVQRTRSPPVQCRW